MEHLVEAVQKAVQIRSYSDEEGNIAQYLLELMEQLDYDEAHIDATGNVIGRVGNGPKSLQFDGHMDTVRVEDAELWQVPPFSGEIVDGSIWGRGSVDMKSALVTAIFAAAEAKKRGLLDGKTVYVTGTVCEEYCDGVNLQHLYKTCGWKPDYCVICEPCNNVITLGHKGKAQVRIITNGISAHGSAPEKGKNAVYEMAEIIQRVEQLNKNLMAQGKGGTVVLSDISCVAASLNAVPSQCSIYLDRRLGRGETLEQVKAEMDGLIAGKDARWEVGTLVHTSWKGEELRYEPMHNPWEISKDHPLTAALRRAVETVTGTPVTQYDFWDFGTNAVTPISLGIPCVGFGPGEYKLAHMRDEHCAVEKIQEAFRVYQQLICEI